MSADGIWNLNVLSRVLQKIFAIQQQIIHYSCEYFSEKTTRAEKGHIQPKIVKLFSEYNNALIEYYTEFNTFLKISQPVEPEETFDFSFLDE